MTDLLDRPIADIAAALRDNRATAADLIEQVIARHDAHDAALGAYIAWSGDGARAQAATADAYLAAGGLPGSLFGLPVSVKDLYGARGFRTYAGTPAPLPAEWEREGPIVTAVRTQHGIVTGKTHTVEFAYGGVGANPHHPVPCNPWDAVDHRAPGGSSAGAGVSLCEGSALIALGSDTGGSVRIPASVTGNVGLKTSTGRWSLDGIVPLCSGLDTAGILTRTVADAAYGFGAFDPAWGDADAFLATLPVLDMSDLHFGMGDGYFWDDCSPGIAEGAQAAVDELTKAGARFSPFALPETTEVKELFQQGYRVSPELLLFIKTALPDRLATLDPNVGRRMGPAGEVTAVEYLDTIQRMARLSASAAERMRDVDIMITPTVPHTPPKMTEVATLDGYRSNNFGLLRNTGIANYLDQCAITMPVALDAAGMPVGLQLTARHGQEERLLAAALACERCLGTGAERIGKAPRIGG